MGERLYLKLESQQILYLVKQARPLRLMELIISLRSKTKEFKVDFRVEDWSGGKVEGNTVLSLKALLTLFIL